MKYRKKPVVIDAVQFDGTAAGASLVFSAFPDSRASFTPELTDSTQGILTIPTLEGDHRANAGDFIIRGVKGEFYPCKPDIFEATYEVVEDA